MPHVLIPDLPIRVQFQTGSTPTTGPFSFSFTYFAPADITVYIGPYIAVIDVHYTLAPGTTMESGIMGGSVTLINPISNTTLTIIRSLPIERVSDFPDAGPFNRQTLNTTLDKHVAMMQQIDERVDRAFVSPPTQPPLTLTAGWFPRVDAGGTGLELIPPDQVLDAIDAVAMIGGTLTGGQVSGSNIIGCFITGGTITGSIEAGSSINGSDINGCFIHGGTLNDTSQLHTTITDSQWNNGGIDSATLTNCNITGGTISGVDIVVPGIGTMAYQNANAVSITGGTISGMPTPTGFSDVATKGYADNLAFGVNKRSTARAATTVGLVLSSVSDGVTLDGVVLASGDRVLFKNQVNPAENGVYTVGPVGPLRSADFDEYDECPGSLVTIQEGTANADTVWLCMSNKGGTLGATAIDFAKVQVSPTLPVVIGQGGTGQVTALAAFDALKQGANETYIGVARQATQAEVDAGTVVEAYVTPHKLAAANRVLGRVPVAQCRLMWENNQVFRLERCNGMYLTVDDAPRAIPEGSLFYDMTPQGDSIFYVYAAYANSVVNGITVSLSLPVLDPRNGVLIHPGQPWLTYIGSVRRAGGITEDTEQVRHVSTYYNRVPRVLRNQQDSSTSSTVTVPLHNPVSWVCEPYSPVSLTFAGFCVNNTSTVSSIIEIMVSGSVLSGGTVIANVGAFAYLPVSVGHTRPLNSAVGAENAQICGHVSGGTLTVNGVLHGIIH